MSDVIAVHNVDKGQYLVVFEGNKIVAIDDNKHEIDFENIAKNKTRSYMLKAVEAIRGQK